MDSTHRDSSEEAQANLFDETPEPDMESGEQDLELAWERDGRDSRPPRLLSILLDYWFSPWLHKLHLKSRPMFGLSIMADDGEFSLQTAVLEDFDRGATFTLTSYYIIRNK